MHLDFKRFADVETVHYYDSESKDYIFQYANKISYCLDNASGKFSLPVPFKFKPFVYSRLGRRLARLDKATCLYVRNTASLVIIYQYQAYVFCLKSKKLKHVKTLTFRNPLFGGTLILDGVIYMGEYFNNSENREVQIYSSKDGGHSWNTIYSFDKNTVHHVHGIYYDKHTDSIWVCTGDVDGQCKIINGIKNRLFIFLHIF